MKAFNTDRLQLFWPLTEVNENHLDWLNDKQLMRWSEQRHHDHTVSSQRLYLQAAEVTGNPIVFDIRLPAMAGLMGHRAMETKSIGTIAAYLDKHNRRADMGIMLGPQYHGKGYGTEAWLGAMRVLQGEFSVQKFEAGYVRGNKPIRELLKRCEFHLEGTRSNHFIIDCQPQDMVMFGRGAL